MTEQPLIFVVGMPRSGTSAVAGSLVALGLESDITDDANMFNEKGFFESPLLGDYCITILDALGGNWAAPPILDQDSPIFDLMVDGAKQAMEQVIPQSPALWKDPRGTLVFPIWRNATSRPVGAVLVWRNPLESVQSLWKWVRFDFRLGLALWAEYNLRALSFTQGLPLYICRYEELLTNPQLLIDGAESVLSELGLPDFSDAQCRAKAAAFFDVKLHRESPPRLAPSLQVCSDSLEPIREYLAKHSGFHAHFDAGQLPDRPQWVNQALRDIRRDIGGVRSTRTRDKAGKAAKRTEINAVNFGAKKDVERYKDYVIESIAIADTYLGGDLDSTRLRPSISVICGLWRPPHTTINSSLASVIAQNCELSICDDRSDDENLSQILAGIGSLPNVSISLNSSPLGLNGAFSKAYLGSQGEFVCLMNQFDQLHPQAMQIISNAIDPEVDIIYTDEDKFEIDGSRFSPDIKPEWSPDLLDYEFYFGHLMVVRRSLLESVGGIGDYFPEDEGYDIALRCSEKARKIVHIPIALYHWNGTGAFEANCPARSFWQHGAMRKSLEESLIRRSEAITGVEDGPFYGTFYVRRPIVENASVTVVILAHSHESGTVVGLDTAIRRSTKAIERTGGSFVREIMVTQIIDNFKELYSQATVLAASGQGDFICFIHADCVPQPGWLEAMLEQISREEIGVVGARIISPQGKIQHSGIRRVAERTSWYGGELDGRIPSSLRWAGSIHNACAVSSACLVTSRELFDSIGGIASDVDYCLKVWQTGKRCLVTPLAEVIHHGVESEGIDNSIDFTERFSLGNL